MVFLLSTLAFDAPFIEFSFRTRALDALSGRVLDALSGRVLDASPGMRETELF